MSFETLAGSLRRQKLYSDNFFDTQTLTSKEKEEITKTFALSLHAEVSDIASAVNFKDHRKETHAVDKNKLLYKSVDAFRYVLALMNLWGFDEQTFIDACEDKDLYLHRRFHDSERSRGDKPVVIFDVDDVIAEFRKSFFQWLNEMYSINADINDKQYYSAAELQKCGLDSDSAFNEFIINGGFRKLETDNTVVQCMKMCQDAGFWVQILTARPSGNLKCFYDTYRWLHEAKIPYDAIAFSPEKYLWLTGQEFFPKKKLICVIDDSSKHSTEFAKHGIHVIVPVKSYNEDTQNVKNITRVSIPDMSSNDLFNLICTFQR